MRSKGPAPHTNGTTGTPAVSPNGASHVAVNGHAVIERLRPSAQEVKAKKKIIARKYKLQRRQRDPDAVNKAVTGRRRNETEDLIRYRFGTLPDTDDRDILLQLWAWSNPYSRDPVKDLREFGHRLGVRLSDAEVKATIRHVEGRRRKFSAKTLGKRLRLTTAERLVLRPTTMTPFDCTPKELESKESASVAIGKAPSHEPNISPPICYPKPNHGRSEA